jgi:hypothetical protein
MIMFEADHEARARALATETPGAQAVRFDAQQTAFPKLQTLVIFCHGTATALCGIPSSAMAAYIARLKAVSPTLSSVEVLTCDARHYSSTSRDVSESYTSQLLRALKANRATAAIVLKGLPVDATANKSAQKPSLLNKVGLGAQPAANGRDAYSILLADVATKSWVYVTAPRLLVNGNPETLMRYAANLITMDDSGTALYKGDIAARAAIKTKITDQPDLVTPSNPRVPRTWTMTYGYFRTLRATLAVVRA